MTRYILTDIEGTTTDIAFVHEVLFPYSRQKIADFVRQNQDVPEVAACLDGVRHAILQETNQPFGSLQSCIDTLIYWIDTDQKQAPLKTLQGMIWRNGYETGEYVGHIYDDVLPQLRYWQLHGIALGVYSSGSVAAQKLLFGHTKYGNLNPLFSHNFDTAVGHKQQTASYQNIANQLLIPAKEILFLSDVALELDAAAQAGMRTVQVVREGTVACTQHTTARDFMEISA